MRIYIKPLLLTNFRIHYIYCRADNVNPNIAYHPDSPTSHVGLALKIDTSSSQYQYNVSPSQRLGIQTLRAVASPKANCRELSNPKQISVKLLLARDGHRRLTEDSHICHLELRILDLFRFDSTGDSTEIQNQNDFMRSDEF